MNQIDQRLRPLTLYVFFLKSCDFGLIKWKEKKLHQATDICEEEKDAQRWRRWRRRWKRKITQPKIHFQPNSRFIANLCSIWLHSLNSTQSLCVCFFFFSQPGLFRLLILVFPFQLTTRKQNSLLLNCYSSFPLHISFDWLWSGLFRYRKRVHSNITSFSSGRLNKHSVYVWHNCAYVCRHHRSWTTSRKYI